MTRDIAITTFFGFLALAAFAFAAAAAAAAASSSSSSPKRSSISSSLASAVSVATTYGQAFLTASVKWLTKPYHAKTFG